MALYFDVTLDSPFGSVTTCLSWHDQHDIVAAGYSLNEGKGGIVSCYNKQVTLPQNLCTQILRAIKICTTQNQSILCLFTRTYYKSILVTKPSSVFLFK